ncbi:flagellar biosynthetic protein FliR [Quadrisphaera sp. RL12-1S]|nr:flagellar biosynthetic protein FliR [Quadrisphaera sp. RL12-1S]MBC3763749.1 flagellar biosynthetic protein FliR [Quadrisphaera sp. RL12-1S]
MPTIALTTVAGHLLVLLRVTAWLAIAPPFSHKAIPNQVKALLALGITLALGSTMDFSTLSLSTADLVLGALSQVLVGASLGFLCYLVFSAVQAAGNMLDLFGGFQAATAYDPQMETGAAVFGRLYQMTTVVLLFASDGYLVVLHGLARSFSVLGLQEHISSALMARLVLEGTTQMFVSALQIAGPLVAVLFLTDVGLGLLTRAAPALQAFSLGFPLKIMVTLALATTVVAALPSVVDAMADQAGTQTVATATAGDDAGAAGAATGVLLGASADGRTAP